MNTHFDHQQEPGTALRGTEGGEEMYTDTNGILPTLQNIVATVNLGSRCTLNLRQIPRFC